MATRTSQRVGIWIIAVVMFVGTLGAFFLPILMNDNAAKESEQLQALQKELEKCPSTSEVPAAKISPAPQIPQHPVIEDIPELKTEDVVAGTGAEVKKDDCVEVLFHGTLAADGKAFQGGSNYASGEPYRALASGFVPGFSKGLVGMKVGGERLMFIPSSEGYGEAVNGEIPANSDLIFSVRVTGIYKP